MLKKEFVETIKPQLTKLNLNTDNIAVLSDAYDEHGRVEHNSLVLHPNYNIPSPDIKPICIILPANSPYSKANLKHLLEHLPNTKPYLKQWSELQRKFKKTVAYEQKVREQEFFDLAVKAGVNHDEHGGSGRGDHFSLRIVDFLWKEKDLKRNFACGKYLGLVAEDRKRVYASSSKWGPTTRTNYYVVGTNENGVPFMHPVTTSYNLTELALQWIWSYHEIEARHGDVAIAPAKIKIRSDFAVEPDTCAILDNHWVSGEVYRHQGCMYVRNAIIYHQKEQHPDVHVGNEWKKVIIGRRSKMGTASTD